MRKILFIFFFTSPFFCNAQGPTYGDYKDPKEYTIADITITGVEFLHPSNILSLANLKPGDKILIPGDRISNAIKKIWEQGLVGDVSVIITKIEGNDIYLEIQLKERPRLSNFVFYGVKKSDRDDILEKIGDLKGSVVTDAMIKNINKKITNFFLDKGYLNAKCTITQERDSLLKNRNHVFLKIHVQKNKKVKIHRIDIQGAQQLQTRYLKQKMKKTKEKKWYKIFTSSKFVRKLYEADKEKIIEVYNSRGFRDAKIISDSIYFYNKKNSARKLNRRVIVQINLHEGNKYYFRNITWKGNYVYSSRQLDSILNIKKGTVYNADLLQRKLNFNPNGTDISSLYLDNGYLFFNVEPVEILVENDSIDIEMRIYEGKEAIINNIYISGNTKTHDHVILREIRTLPGNKFSRADLIRSQRELAMLGYFDPEKIEINPVPNPSKGTVDIHYKVEEKANDQIQLSGGWGGGRNMNRNVYTGAIGGFVGTLGVVFNNFSLRNVNKFKTWDPLPSGDGQRLSINFSSTGRMYQNYALSFMEPWFGGKKPISFSTSFNHSRINYFVGANRDIKQHLDISNFSLGLGRRLKRPDDNFSLSNSLSYSLYHYINFPLVRNVIGIDTGYSNNISFITSLSRNSINEPQFPTAGSSVAITLSLTPPYSLFNGVNYSDPNLSPRTRYKFIEYHKWMFDSDWYARLISGKKRSLVLRAKANAGFIASYNPATGIGPFERFILGGNGLSGFVNNFIGTDLIGLRGYEQGALPAGKFNGVGGTVFNKYTMELRYPVVSSQALSLSIHAFFEAGNTWIRLKDFSPFDNYRALGFGAKIFMPAFGMIGLDYGWPLDVVPNTANPYKPVFTFSIGQQLR